MRPDELDPHPHPKPLRALYTNTPVTQMVEQRRAQFEQCAHSRTAELVIHVENCSPAGCSLDFEITDEEECRTAALADALQGALGPTN